MCHRRAALGSPRVLPGAQGHPDQYSSLAHSLRLKTTFCCVASRADCYSPRLLQATSCRLAADLKRARKHYYYLFIDPISTKKAVETISISHRRRCGMRRPVMLFSDNNTTWDCGLVVGFLCGPPLNFRWRHFLLPWQQRGESVSAAGLHFCIARALAFHTVHCSSWRSLLCERSSSKVRLINWLPRMIKLTLRVFGGAWYFICGPGEVFFVNTWGDKTPVDFCPSIVSWVWGQLNSTLRVCALVV